MSIAEPPPVDLAALEAQIRAFNKSDTEDLSADSPVKSGTDWRLVIDTSNDAFLSVDASGVIYEWNATAEKLFGWKRDEAVGSLIKDTIFPERADGSGGMQSLVKAGREGARLEAVAQRRDGSPLPAEVSMSMMHCDGEIYFNAFVHDISNRRELQGQLAHAQKLESIGQLSAGIAHEINTPTQYVGDNTRFVRDALEDVFAAVDAYANLAEKLRDRPEFAETLAVVEAAVEAADLDYLTDELRNAVGQTLEGVDRVSSIVRAMKEFSHPGAATKTPTNLNDAIKATITVATNEWKYVANVETDFDESLPLVPCLPGDFNQVILNIIVNASHAIGDKIGKSGDKGVVKVSTRNDDSWAEIRISDNGTGIPKEVINRIFDPFFTTKDVGVGTGQGLAISRSVIVDKHCGTLAVESEVGVGSTFTIRIPFSGCQSNGGLV